MSNDITKFRLAIGDFQVDYEGPESFLREGIHDLIERLVDHYGNHGASTPAPDEPIHDENDSNTHTDGDMQIDSPRIDLSVSTIATRIRAKTGPELAIAAAAHLTLVQSKDRFSRQEILYVSTIATRIRAKTGPELAIAAAAHLTLVQSKDRFSRQEILYYMKNAPGIYKKTFSNNLGSSLQRLIGSQRLNEVAVGRYALSATEKHRVETALAVDV